jgi:hypothetical protein
LGEDEKELEGCVQRLGGKEELTGAKAALVEDI